MPPRRPSPPLTATDRFEEAIAMDLLAHRRGRPQRAAGANAGRLAERYLEAELGEKVGRSLTVRLGQIKARWVEIVGQRLATVSRPDRLSSGTLVLMCIPAAAPMLTAATVEIVGLLRLAGFGEVRGLRLVHVSLRQFAEGQCAATGRPRPKPLSPTEQAALEERLAAIEDPKLRAAVRKLAEMVNTL